MKMSLSKEHRTLFLIDSILPGFKLLDLKTAAAVKLTAAVCLLGKVVHARRTTEPPVA
jgi:hypothetical protein